MKPAWCVFAAAGWLGTASAEPLLVSSHAPDEAVLRAQQCFQRGDYLATAGIYEKLLAAAPDNFEALSNLGVVRFRLNQLGGAAEVLERAARLAPDDMFMQCTLGLVYYRQARLEEAGELLRRAAGRNPRNASVHRLLTLVYSRQGRADRVREEWGKIYGLELAPGASLP